MKKFKTIDFYGSVILITAAIIYGLFAGDFNFIIGYFVVGGWQIMNIITHAANGWFCNKGGGRRQYHTLVAVLFAIALVGIVAWPLLMLVLVILLFIAPFMAISYAIICHNELTVKMQRPLYALK